MCNSVYIHSAEQPSTPIWFQNIFVAPEKTLYPPFKQGFPGGSKFSSQCVSPRFNPWVGKIPWCRNGNPFQYSCPKNPMDREACWAMIYGVQRVGHDWASEHTSIQPLSNYFPPPSPDPQSLENTDSLSVSMKSSILDISYKWNYTTFDLSCLASFT